MREKEKYVPGYGRLKRKIFCQTALMMLFAFFAVWGSYLFVWYGRFAEAMVALLQWMFGMDYDSALLTYRHVFRQNFSYIMLGAMIVVFAAVFWFFLNWFMKYFKEIDRGVDMLIDRESDAIEMSREMEPMEQKLNQVQQTLKRQFLEIQDSERKKDELVMYLAHDIRTPLTSVIGYLNLMQEMPDLTEEQRKKFLAVTLEKAERLEVLVSEFFDITRYNPTETALHKEEIDLSYMLIQLKEEAYPMLAEKQMCLEITAPEDSVVCGDAEKLARIFHNLLKNAISYGDAGSEILISAGERECETIVSFTNSGAVIHKEEQARIFEKFYRMDDARQSNSGGAGLGLAIAKELAVMHGGDITVMSEEGRTTFEVMLPKE